MGPFSEACLAHDPCSDVGLWMETLLVQPTLAMLPLLPLAFPLAWIASNRCVLVQSGLCPLSAAVLRWICCSYAVRMPFVCFLVRACTDPRQAMPMHACGPQWPRDSRIAQLLSTVALSLATTAGGASLSRVSLLASFLSDLPVSARPLLVGCACADGADQVPLHASRAAVWHYMLRTGPRTLEEMYISSRAVHVLGSINVLAFVDKEGACLAIVVADRANCLLVCAGIVSLSLNCFYCTAFAADA
jgi:hypothetical protein